MTGFIDGFTQYARMFYVHHSVVVHEPDDSRLVFVGPERLAELVVDAGLVGWLLRKVG